MQATEAEIAAARRAIYAAAADLAKNGPAPTRQIPHSNVRQFTERDAITLAIQENDQWWGGVAESYPNTHQANEAIGRVLKAVHRVMDGDSPHDAPDDCEPYISYIDAPAPHPVPLCRVCQIVEVM